MSGQELESSLLSSNSVFIDRLTPTEQWFWHSVTVSLQVLRDAQEGVPDLDEHPDLPDGSPPAVPGQEPPHPEGLQAVEEGGPAPLLPEPGVAQARPPCRPLPGLLSQAPWGGWKDVGN